MADISKIIQSAQRVLRGNLPAPVRDFYDAYERVGQKERQFAGNVAKSYVSGLRPFGEALGIAVATPQVSKRFAETQKQNFSTVDALNRMIDKTSGAQKQRFVTLRDEVLSQAKKNGEQYKQTYEPTKASSLIPAAGKAALTTAGSLAMAGMPVAQAGVSAGVSGGLGGVFGALGGQSLEEGVASGIGQTPFYTGVGQLGSAVSKPLVGKLVGGKQYETAKKLWQTVGLSNLISGKPQLTGLARPIALDVLSRGLEGAVGGTITGALQEAKTPEDRWSNIKSGALYAGLFSGGTRLGMHGIEAGKELGPYVGALLQSGVKQTGQAGYYIGEKGMKPTDRKFSFVFDKTLRSEIGDTKPTIYPNKIEADLYRTMKTGQFTKKDIAQYFDDEQLFKRYPQLKDYTIEFYFGDGPETAFSYGPQKRIGINAKIARPIDIADAMVHELQHSIDFAEGYPAGGAPTEVTNKYANMKNTGTVFYRNLSGEMIANDAEIRRGMTAQERATTPPFAGQNIDMQDILIKTDKGVVPSQSMRNFGEDYKTRGVDFKAGKYKEAPFIGLLPKDGKVEAYSQKYAESKDYHHSFILKDTNQWDNDTTLRFVRNGNENAFTINGGAVLDPFGEGKEQITTWAKDMVKRGVDPSMPIKVENLSLPSTEAPYQGKTIGTIGDFVGKTSYTPTIKFTGSEKVMFGSGKQQNYDIKLDGKKVGYVSYSQPRLGELKIEDIGVDDAYQRQGIATDVITQLEKKTGSKYVSSGQIVSESGKALDKSLSSRGIEAKVQSTDSMAMNRRAITSHGLTDDPESIGYLMRNGKGIDSSGRKQGSGMRGRVVDHREIAQDALGDTPEGLSGNQAMAKFMNETGNIRVVSVGDEVNIDIPIAKGMISKEQISQIRQISDGKTINYDISDYSGSNIKSGTGSVNSLLTDLRSVVKGEAETAVARASGQVPPALEPLADFIKANKMSAQDLFDARYDKNNPLHQKTYDMIGRAMFSGNKVWEDFGYSNLGDFANKVLGTKQEINPVPQTNRGLEFKIKQSPQAAGQVPMFNMEPQRDWIPTERGWKIVDKGVDYQPTPEASGAVRQEFAPTAYQRHQDILGDRLLQGVSRVSGSGKQSWSPPDFGVKLPWQK